MYNNRRLIWESKAKQIWIVLGLFLFVVIAFWVKHKISSFMFWMGIVLFGGCGLFLLIQIINQKNLFVTHDSELGKQILADQFQKAQEDMGLFTYNETGFDLTEYNGVKHYDWSEIETIFGFKEDRLTTDEVCMDIFFSGKASVRLTESTSGWYQFNKKLSQAIQTVSEKWETEVVHPPFDTNMTLLFDKKGRSKEQAEKACYSD
jgi:hypothetical protein